MYVVLGAAGNVGSSVVEALKPSGEKILAIVHSEKKAAALSGGNVEAVVQDVSDTEGLRAVFRRAKHAFLLNPPAAPATDTNAEELKTARSIAAALEGSGLEKLVLQSAYGAQQGDGIGDLSVLYELERLVEASGIPAAINRGAYYFTNLDMLVEQASQGAITTPFPADLEIPMVSPTDLGQAAAIRLTSPLADTGLQYVEGLRRYTFTDVAAAFSSLLGKPVSVETTPRDQLEQSFRQAGFSPTAARAYARMTEATIDRPELPSDPQRGKVTLEAYVAGLG